MKNNKNIVFFFIITLINAHSVFGQQEQALNFLTNTWQAHLTNPALLPSKKVAVALPSLYFNLNSPDLKVNDLVITENGLKKLDPIRLYAPERAEIGHLTGHLQLQTLGISFPVSDRLSLSLYQAGTTTPSVNYRRDLAQLFFNGNAAFLGKTVAFGSSANMSIRSEIGLGAIYRLPAITIGGRVKLHSGLASIFTQADKLDISFNQTDYTLGFNTDINVLTFSGEKIKNLKNVQSVLNQGFISQNKGLSFDLGGSMKLGKLQLNASLIDIAGSINWKNEGKTFASKGTYNFKGRDEKSFEAFFKVDSLGVKTFTDTLKQIIGLTETASATYTQKLPMKIYISGAYQMNEKVAFNVLIYNESGSSEASHTGFALGTSVNIVDVPKIMKLRAGLTYGLRNGQFNNLGGHITVNALQFIQIFAVTDNILTAFNPYNANNANGRVGMGLIF